MQIVEAPGAAQRLRRSLGRPAKQFQATFRTPLKQLKAFTVTVLNAPGPITAGEVTLQQVVFSAKNLEELLAVHGLPPRYGQDWTIRATGQHETTALLEAVWGDWLDFYFTPTPKRYRLFADHDEYTTIFAATKGHLGKVAAALADSGFSRVAGYERTW